MAMSTRPFTPLGGMWLDVIPAFKIHWDWWLVRLPMFLLAIPAAYGVGAFAGEYLPNPINWIAGLAFEATYIGAIAIADQQRDEDDKITLWLWIGVNVFAVVASVLSNLLFFAGGKYANITLEIATHAVPLPLLGFAYGLLVHRSASKAAHAAYIKQQEDEEEARRQAEQEVCPGCGEILKNRSALYGHLRQRPVCHAVWSNKRNGV